MLPDTYEITVADLQRRSKQNMTLQPGDAVLIHTGWGKLWGKDNPRYVKAARASVWRPHMARATGSDARRLRQLAGRSVPNPDAQLSLPVHQIMLVVNGIHLLENLKLDELARRGVRVRLHGAAAQDAGGHGLDRLADGGALTHQGRSRRRPAMLS